MSQAGVKAVPIDFLHNLRSTPAPVESDQFWGYPQGWSPLQANRHARMRDQQNKRRDLTTTNKHADRTNKHSLDVLVFGRELSEPAQQRHKRCAGSTPTTCRG